MNMQVTLVAHFEWVEEAGQATWWADSPDAPGFYAAAPSFGELQREAPEALLWSLEASDVEVEWAAEDDVPEWAATHVALSGEGVARVYSSGVGPHSRQTVLLFGPVTPWRIAREDDEHNFSLLV